MTAPSREEVEALIAKLREDVVYGVPNGTSVKAADALTSILARLSEVEKALEPFADAASYLGLASAIVAHVENDIVIETSFGYRSHIKPNDLRRAYAALHPKG